MTFVKIKKPAKNKSLTSSWESLFMFVKYLDGNGFLEHNEGRRICMIKGKEEQFWGRP
jgi:hypothetical protein